MSMYCTHQIFVKLQQSWIFRQESMPLLKLLVDLLLELGQQLLQGFLHSITLFNLVGGKK